MGSYSSYSYASSHVEYSQPRNSLAMKILLIELSMSRTLPPYSTNFFNQSEKTSHGASIRMFEKQLSSASVH